jgi:hypothetical protein
MSHTLSIAGTAPVAPMLHAVVDCSDRNYWNHAFAGI